MKHNRKIFCIGLVLFLIFLAGYSNKLTGNVAIANKVGSVEKIEVYHFHSNRQCSVCKIIGSNLDETISRYFLEQVAGGKIIYGHINIQLPKNEEIIKRYGATGTSLWIGVYDENGFHAENDRGIWYKLQDKEAFISYLKKLIEKRLSGDVS
jgi:frataxin-like iron-binding protein CyaY